MKAPGGVKGGRGRYSGSWAGSWRGHGVSWGRRKDGARGRRKDGGERRRRCKEQEGDVRRDNFGELFRGQVCPLCVGKGNTQRAHLTPEKFTKIVLHPGGGFLRPVAEGVGNCLQPVSEGSRGKHHPRGAGGKSHTTPHNTTPIPNRPRPHHNTPITDTETLHTAPHHTRSPRTPHQALPQEQHQQKPSYQKNTIFPEEMHLFRNAPKPGQSRPQGNHHPRTLHPVGTRAPLYSKMTM